MRANIMESQEDGTEAIAKIADARGAPGILVLSTNSNVVYINRRGWELVHHFHDAKVISASGGVLPCVINEVYEELQAIVREPFAGKAGKDSIPPEVRRMGPATPRPILVRGLLLPRTGGLQSKVLILLEVVGRAENDARYSKERFRLTRREEMVLENLAKGRTNKEIACELDIAEQTVKVYIRQIMDKTNSTTRTGILARVLGA
jgi:DNA-binding CsgD family transcriptional regulator